MKKILPVLISALVITLFNSCDIPEISESSKDTSDSVVQTSADIQQEAASISSSFGDIPAYSGEAYVVINNNIPYFDEDALTTDAFEIYSPLDDLGRCGVAYANICKELMPEEKRGDIGSVKPTGWQSVKYDNVEGKFLYNRCHLIGYQLAGENANKQNLITGTRYMNVTGMLPFENMVADFVEETNNHVLYRVTPVFEDDNLVADGVLMEAFSVEDNGEGVEFNVFCYNIQPGISINYANGDSCLSSESPEDNNDKTTYILNINNHKFHKPTCDSVEKMNSENKQEYTGSRDELINNGYEACKKCNP